MVQARVSSIATQGSNGIAKVGMGPQHGIYESAKGILIRLGGDFRRLKLDKVLIGEG